MSYQALLFCPDEKTARVVSQVLSELEFTVEPCHEPFSAVKKLMVQHFDALVVDCDNEQNAALLFKSARNSGSNQASLAVAVVEGQTGVAKAFRLGANLVLTKPIHVEQSKGTLRVARGLLRKGQAAKAAASAPSAAPPTLFATPTVAAPFAPSQPTAAPPSMSAAAFELDAEPMPAPDPADAALLEYMPDSPVSSTENSSQPAVESDPSKQYPWQPRKPLAEPMASALRRAAEAAGKTEFDAAAPRSAGAVHASAPQSEIAQSGNPQAGVSPKGTAQPAFTLGNAGAAAAPARAKEIPAPDAKKLSLEPTASAIETPSTEEIEIKRIEDPSASDGWESNKTSLATEASSSTALEGDTQASDAGGSKKTLLIVVVLLGLAAAGYFGWTKMQSSHSQPAAPQSAVPASSETATLPPQPAASSESQPLTVEVGAPQAEPVPNGATVVTAPSKPSAAVTADGPAVKTPAPAKAASADDGDTSAKAPAAEKTEAAPVLMVQNGSSNQSRPQLETQEAEQAPAVTSIATGASTDALSGVVNTNAMNAAKAPQQMLRISQGVSEGLVIKRVQPVYPPQARQMHIEGKVELQANISASGSISSVKQLSGDPMLGRAAIDAVRQWKYKPYFLNGDPVAVETQITVNFKLP